MKHQDTIRAYDSMEKPVTPIRWAYHAYNTNNRHQKYYVKLRSGKYFPTIRLVEDIQTIYTDAVIEHLPNSRNHYAIKVNNIIVDYIIFINTRNTYRRKN